MKKKEYMTPETIVVPLIIEQIMTIVSGVEETDDFSTDPDTEDETTDTPL